MIGVAAFDGVAPRGLMINTWNSDEDWYVAVVGRNGTFSVAAPFKLSAAIVPGDCSASSAVLPASTTVPTAPVSGSYRTIIVTDLSRIVGTSQDKYALKQKLNELAELPEVKGVGVDLAGVVFDSNEPNHSIVSASPDARVLAANAQADALVDCPAAKGAVAEAIKGVIQDYRSVNPGLEFVVLVGNDDVIPFFRHPDQTDLGTENMYVPPVMDQTTSQASLRLDYVLSQDDYGAVCDVSAGGRSLPLADLAVGRLVETPAEIMGMIDAYLDGAKTALDGVANLRVVKSTSSSLVTGYDFLAAGALAIQANLVASLDPAAAHDSLITPATQSPQAPEAWTADQLRALLLGKRHDLMFLAGHFSASALLAADYSTHLLASELASSAVDLEDAIVVSGGCHSGYNTVDPHDVPGITLGPGWVAETPS